MRASQCTLSLSLALLVLTLAPALARAEAQAGAVDWTNRTIKCKGTAAPGIGATPGQKRVATERAAKLDAMRNILETLKGVQVSGGKTAADAMTDSGVSARVQGVIRNYKVTDTRYFDDGAVEVDVEMPLDGLVSTLVPEGAKTGESTSAPTSTGVVVDAHDIKVSPALAPRIVDQSGNEVYGPGKADPDKAKAGLAAYTKDLASAEKDPRVGSQPTVVKAIGLANGSPSDVVISNDDAKKARDAKVAEGNVVFVVQDATLAPTPVAATHP
jgi:hypothetical protein